MITPQPVRGLHRNVVQLLFVLFLSLVFVSIAAAPAYASKRAYAGIVVDAKTGKTLYSRSADATRYPASVAKVMTLYVLFQELEAGNLKLSSRLNVSKHAAAAVPTKLGLRAGSTISVEDAIKSLVTLSANDMARVIAENISGTESQFAVRMTRTAKSLGMNNTTYRNASGLPDSRQITTVRDQSRLAIAIYQHFPKYYEYFQTTSFKYGSRSYGNHNRLLGKNGVDGIKTGFIRAAGYNLMTAARKNDRHIVVIAFGFESGASRNAKVASLVSANLSKARRGSYYAQARIAKPRANGTIRVAAVPVTPMPRPANRGGPVPLVAVAAPAKPLPPAATVAVALSTAPAPEPRPIELLPATAVAATQQLASVESGAPRPQPKPDNIVGAWISETLSLEPNNQRTGVLLPPARIGTNTPATAAPTPATIDLLTSGSVEEPATVTAWIVQVGASHNETGAESLLVDAVSKQSDLTNFRSFVEPTKKNGQTFYRARFAGFGDRSQALDVCNKLKQQKMSCLAMQS